MDRRPMHRRRAMDGATPNRTAMNCRAMNRTATDSGSVDCRAMDCGAMDRSPVNRGAADGRSPVHADPADMSRGITAGDCRAAGHRRATIGDSRSRRVDAEAAGANCRLCRAAARSENHCRGDRYTPTHHTHHDVLAS